MGAASSTLGAARATVRAAAALAVVLAIHSEPLVAQCAVTPPPATPLPTRIEASSTVVYSDGYVTEGTLLVPAAAAPACGWPLVVFVHRLGNNRAEDIDWQHRLASHGYAVWTFDVRGQGMGPALNPAGGGTTMFGGHETLDLAEQIGFARGRFAGLVHPEVVAVTGSSQGGVHAWMAAAFSGQTVSAAGRPSLTFPTVAAVAAYDFVPDPMGHRLRDGAIWSHWMITVVADDTVTGFDLDPNFRQEVRQAFLNQDPASLVQAWQQQPGRIATTQLQQIAVPVLYSHAYHDLVCSPRPALDVLQQLPASTPWRAQWSTIGHNTPHNARERELRDQLTLRWFERFLYGVDNEVDREERVLLASMPLDAVVREDPSSLWGQAHDRGLTGGYSPLRFYLVAGGGLDRDVPAPGSGVPVTLSHTVAAGFDPALWLTHRTERTPSRVEQSIPLSEVVYTTTALVEELQLGGQIHVDLEVVPTAADFELVALLSARVPGRPDVMLTHWARAVRGATVGQPRRVGIELGPCGAVLPPGGQLVLTLRNLWIREAPMERKFAAVPSFRSWSVDVVQGGSSPSWIEVGVRDARSIVLDTPHSELDHANPVAVPLAVRAGLGRAGKPYFIVGGGSGRFPEYPLPGGRLGVELDQWSALIGQGVGTSEFVGFVGVLDGFGEAAAVMDLSAYAPLDPAFVGLELIFCAWVYRASTDIFGAASNSVRVRFL